MLVVQGLPCKDKCFLKERWVSSDGTAFVNVAEMVKVTGLCRTCETKRVLDSI